MVVKPGSLQGGMTSLFCEISDIKKCHFMFLYVIGEIQYKIQINKVSFQFKKNLVLKTCFSPKVSFN